MVLTLERACKGGTPDNAASKGFLGLLKNKLIYSRDWREATLEDFMRRTDDFFRWYNEPRVKLSLNSRSSLSIVRR